MKNNRPLISPELLDNMLDMLLQVPSLETHHILTQSSAIKELNNIDKDIINAMFIMLEEDGLITNYGINARTFEFVVKGKASSFKRLGGYRAKEDIINKQLILLEDQIKDLQDKKILDKTSSIVGIMGV